mgnify:FL=1
MKAWATRSRDCFPTCHSSPTMTNFHSVISSDKKPSFPTPILKPDFKNIISESTWIDLPLIESILRIGGHLWSPSLFPKRDDLDANEISKKIIALMEIAYVDEFSKALTVTNLLTILTIADILSLFLVSLVRTVTNPRP